MRAKKKKENEELVANGKKKKKVPDKRIDPYRLEDNKIKLHRGTKMSRNELFQFERWLGQKVYSKSFLSTTTSLMTAKEFCGHYSKIPAGLERVLFDIYLDLDFTNDTGSYIMLMSEAACEDEWLLGPGAEFEIGLIKPVVMTNRSKEQIIDIDEEKDEEDQL